MKYILIFIYYILLDYAFFGITAKLCGKACNYNCQNCKNWACTHGVIPKPKNCYPVRDWSKWCQSRRKNE